MTSYDFDMFFWTSINTIVHDTFYMVILYNLAQVMGTPNKIEMLH